MIRYGVNSIADYLNLIETKQLTNFIYRGQNEPYFGIQASGFRPYTGAWRNDKFYDINGIKKDFYNKVIRNISMDEKEYFLAFCQHHGLPTNLVDFTYSPLIAMFFACQGKKSPTFTIGELIDKETFTNINNLKNDNSLQEMLINNLINKLSKNFYAPYSEIYLINKDRLLDITDIIVENHDDNFFQKLICDSNVQKLVLKKLEEMFLKNKNYFKNWIKNIIECYEENNIDIYGICTEDNDDIFPKKENFKWENLTKYKEHLLNNNIDETIRELYWYVFNEMEDEEITYNNVFCLNEWEFGYVNVEF
ncbi:FRG domain-containing protein [Clostridium botulinum]|nr:FRG domain-containing protein [Clostridium botulinum]